MYSPNWGTNTIKLLIVLACSHPLLAQRQLPSTFPHNYTGIPSGGYGSDWQAYFEVTDSLPNVTEPVSRSFAGNIAVDRPGHPNDTLWFWAFERENGSLTARAGERQDEPWLVWLNGGPGSSSQLGMMTENGPLRVQGDFSITQNNFSWHKLADAFWVDQPVGVGYSTSDATGYVFDEDQLGEDFVRWLANVVKVFPSLATRPFYLTGESYAGVFIPYITKAIFSTPNPPVKLSKIAIGDGAMGSFPGYEEISTVTTLEAYPQIINFDQEVFQYFREQTHLCGYDINLTYPQTGGHFASLKSPFDIPHNSRIVFGGARSGGNLDLDYKSRAASVSALVKRADHARRLEGKSKRQTHNPDGLTLDQWKQDHLSKGVLNPDYGCFLWEEMTDFATNFTFPWSQGDFDPYDIPDALNPEVPANPTVFLNDPRTRAAVHAPDKNWASSFAFPFGNSTGLSEVWSLLIANSRANSDVVKRRQGIHGEILVSNLLRSCPNWLRTLANMMSELSYMKATPTRLWLPLVQKSFIFLREFIIGNNSTGLVTDDGGTVTVVGGEDPTLSGPFMPADTAAIFYGRLKTESSSFAPSAAIAQWRSFIATATNTDSQAQSTAQDSNGASTGVVAGASWTLIITIVGLMTAWNTFKP
ncbi:hypothetical protein PM082_003935 [Marasmius tenuissimus]|nr:hypothetical protein PM082_003935 [Marasmius tenuissimus]